MRKFTLVIKHLLITLTSFLSIFLVLQIFSRAVAEGWLSPDLFKGIALTQEESLLFSLNVLIILSSVLVSYVIYLLTASRSRAELWAEQKTKSITSSLTQLKHIYEDAPVPYITLDKDGNILDPNKAALRFFEATTNEISGKNLFYYQPEEDLEKAERLVTHYKSNLSINREELRMVTKEGKIRSVLLSVFKIEGPIKDGRVGLASIFDISEQKELDRAKTEFVSLASHQLRTPAATIKWFIKMLLSGDLGSVNEKQLDYLERINKVNDNMIDIVETILNISRIEVGSIIPNFQSVNVPKIIDSVLFELSADIEKKGLKVIKNYGEDLTDLRSDPKLLQIVVANLVSNAVKYTTVGGEIIITLKESFGDRRISVADNGLGIPINEQPKIFGKMFRASNVQKLSGAQGTGLGLYLVKSLIQTLGGSIEFASAENKGSIFTIKI